MQSVLIADNHPLIRSGIRSVIAAILPAVRFAEAENQSALEVALTASCHDLIILDIALTGFSFPADFSVLSAPIKSGSRVIIFSEDNESVFALRCLKLGASGFLYKTASEAELIHAIQKVVSGRIYFPPGLTDQVADLATHDLPANPLDVLSAREIEVAALINKGLSLPEISRRLNLGYSTCNTYKRRIFEKLNIHNAVSLSRLIQTCLAV